MLRIPTGSTAVVGRGGAASAGRRRRGWEVVEGADGTLLMVAL